MPGFFITNIKDNSSFRLEGNEDFLNGEIKTDRYIIKRSVLKSFLSDKIFSESEDLVVITDGIIYDSDQIVENLSAEEAFFYKYKENPLFFSNLKGHFSGAFYDKRKDEWLIYTSCFGDRSIFYYYDDETGRFILGSELRYVTEYMKSCSIERTLDNHGMKCLLDFGYFLDASTGVSEVKRLFPGDYITINSETGLSINNYFTVDYEQVEYNEAKAIEKLDNAFSNALRRISRKNESDARTGLADLSGGLDSRMICYGFDKIGSDTNIALTYSQSDSSDEKVAKRIASELGLDWMFLSLDSGNCLKDIDQLTLLNNGTSYYFGITGGKILLESLNKSKFGLETTGILGDIHESSMIGYAGSKEVNVHEARYKLSSKTPLDLDYNYSKEKARFKDNEMYWYYIRGALAGLSTFHIRRNYVEPVTPFADLEFLEAYFSIPWEIRCKEKTLLKWMINKYPNAAKIPYAATGMSVINEDKFIVKVIRRIRLKFDAFCAKLAGRPASNSMNPLDYWIATNEDLRRNLDMYFESNRKVLDGYSNVLKQVEELYSSSRFTDKGLGLFIISYVKNYIK